ncbi:MAG: response regulator, partial [Polyangiaceae bacterium]
GYEVVTRTDALGTSTAIAQESPDVVLLDLSMPGLSGERLAKLISQNPRRHVAVIFHTAKDPRDVDDAVRECKALGAIQKTSDDELFLLQFERLLLTRKPTG